MNVTCATEVISWDTFHKDTAVLADRLAEEDPFEALFVITRGGLAAAAIIASQLDIRLIETVCISSYDERERRDLNVLKSPSNPIIELGQTASKLLVLDDLADSGQTAKAVRNLLPGAHLATVYAKPQGQDLIDSYAVKKPQDVWLLFPWDQRI